MSIQIAQARPEHADSVATLVGELLHEIMVAVKTRCLLFITMTQWFVPTRG